MSDLGEANTFHKSGLHECESYGCLDVTVRVDLATETESNAIAVDNFTCLQIRV